MLPFHSFQFQTNNWLNRNEEKRESALCQKVVAFGKMHVKHIAADVTETHITTAERSEEAHFYTQTKGMKVRRVS